MTRRFRIFAGALLVTAAFAAFTMWARPPAAHVSISFHGYTNSLPQNVPTGDESEAVFILTNHTASDLRCEFTFDAFRPGHTESESWASGETSLPARSFRALPVVTPGTTKGWRFLTVVSATGPPPL